MTSKNIIFFILLVSLVFSCKKSEKDNTIRIAFSQCLSDHPWRDAMNESMKIKASLYPEVQLTIYEAKNDIQQQISHVELMIKNGVDAIIISPLDPNAIAASIEKAYDKGIPIIVLDRKVNTGKYTAFIGADNLEVGRNAGRYIASTTQENSNVIELRGSDVSSPVNERSQGFRQIIDTLRRVTLLASMKGIDRGVHKEKFKELLDSLKKEKVDYVYAFNDEMALQAWEVARDIGREKEIKFIGVDGLAGGDGGIESVLRGILEATILYPTGGAEAIEVAVKAINGENVQKNNKLNTTVIDRFNADIMKNQFDKINDQQKDLENQIAAITYQEERYAAQNNLLRLMMVLSAVILSLTAYSIYSMVTIRKKKRELELTNEQVTIQKNQISKFAKELEVSNEAKVNFFTGLSHEFKTPITLILSSIESIGENAKVKGIQILSEVELIYNNSNRLLRLINNLLDFKKVEDRKFNLRASKTNLLAFSNSIFNDFKREAKRRNISFGLSTNNDDLDIYIDRNLIDKVYFNILSNAFKFTPDNGKIHITINDHQESNKVSIHFKDSGIGIPQNEIKNVFQPFFKGSNNRKNSSGIGLHLCKEFVALHKGEIKVSSIHGTEFIVTLYKGSAHFNEDEITVEPDLIGADQMDFMLNSMEKEDYLVGQSPEGEEKYSVLIIEDNRELSAFLGNKLRQEYKIYISDGTDAIDKALETIPDIIICDIMLPDKSGFEICEILKQDLRTSHIPIIVLTALGNKESYMKGLKSGADLYLTKPFSYSILVQSIKTLLYNREKLRVYFTHNIHRIDHFETFGNLEQEFVQGLNKQIHDNLDNNDFSVEQLAESLNLSRVQLYRKVKAILGISVSDYINNFKLEKAKGLLDNTSLSISEIAYSIGFSTPNYFSTAFKNKYGVSPMAHRKSL